MPEKAPLRIALTMRVVDGDDGVETRDAISRDWIKRLNTWNMTPLLFPNGLSEPQDYLTMLAPDLIVLTGGGEPGIPTERAHTEEAALIHSAKTGTPVLGICRGMQVINRFFGGVLHRIDGHVGELHRVTVEAHWAPIYDLWQGVNSFHEWGIATEGLGKELSITARDAGGWIEGFVHRTRPLAGIMWHPERDGAPFADRTLFERLARDGRFWS